MIDGGLFEQREVAGAFGRQYQFRIRRLSGLREIPDGLVVDLPQLAVAERRARISQPVLGLGQGRGATHQVAQVLQVRG
jgi:hypothetical protein